MKHKVYLSSFDKVKNGKGIKIGVVRFIPATKNDYSSLESYEKNDLSIRIWLSGLSPSTKLLLDYKNNSITWEEFKIKFIEETKNVDFMNMFVYLLKLLKESDVTLYCYCNNKDKHCHRFILGEMLEKAGYEVKEL